MSNFNPKSGLTYNRSQKVQRVCVPILLTASGTPDLGAAASFAVLANSTVTNTGNSVLTGNLGLYPGTSVTGFPPGTFSGTEHVADSTADNAQIAAQATYTDLQSRPAGTTESALGGLTLTAGTYTSASSMSLTGTLTLNAAGNPNAVWIFQIGSTLTTASASSVVLENGAQAGNVYWQVGSSATLGTTTTFVGNIIAEASITVNTGASVNGSLIALTGAVTLADNAVSVAAGSSSAPTITSDETAMIFFQTDNVNQISAQLAVNETATYTQATNDSSGIFHVLVAIDEPIAEVTKAELTGRTSTGTAFKSVVLGSATGITTGTAGGSQIMLTVNANESITSNSIDACLEVQYTTKF
jgi:Ice-binding-like